jgi:hypothetical protein
LGCVFVCELWLVLGCWVVCNWVFVLSFFLKSYSF